MSYQSDFDKDSFTVKVKGGKSSPFAAVIRAISAVFILVASLTFYLLGILLTLTVIGALIGIPLIIATYAIDAVALAIFINLREKIYSITCPKCAKKRFVMPALKPGFICKRCLSRIRVVTV